jgi:squalene cyclase
LRGYDDAVNRAWAFLCETQRSDGRWESYWWTTDLQATTQAILLGRIVGSDACDACDRALAWCLERQRPEGNWLDDQFGVPSAMATALALVIVKGHDDRAFARGAAWLSGIGRGDGSWDAAPTLRIPPPWILDPTSFKAWRIDGLGSGVIVRDHHRTYTTATVIHALLS